jgi:hypothetical protein
VTDIYASGGIKTRNPSKRAAANPRLRPRGHWDRHVNEVLLLFVIKAFILPALPVVNMSRIGRFFITSSLDYSKLHEPVDNSV